MQAVKLTGTVTADRKLTLELPESVQPGLVEVLVLSEDASADDVPPDNAPLLALLEELEAEQRPGKTVSALDERLKDERASWG